MLVLLTLFSLYLEQQDDPPFAHYQRASAHQWFPLLLSTYSIIVHADRPESLDEMDESGDADPELPDVKLGHLPADPMFTKELEAAIKGLPHI